MKDLNPGRPDRHPGQGHRGVHVCSEHPPAGHAPRADRPATRPGRLSVQLERPGQRRCDVDRPHSGCQGRAGEQLHWRHRAEGVRRHPGGRAAQGRLEHEPDPSGHRQPLEPLPQARFCGLDRGDGAHQHGQRRHSARCVGAYGRGQLRPSLSGPHADRAELRRRRRPGQRGDDLEQHSERLQPRARPAERALAACGEPDPGSCSTRAQGRSETAVSRSEHLPP